MTIPAVASNPSPAQPPPDGSQFQTVVEREHRLRLALEAAGLGVWENDLAAGLMRLDDRAQALYGTGPTCAVSDIIARVHPDDRERVLLEIEAALDPGLRAPVVTEYRLLRAQGGVRWLRVLGRVEFEGEAPGGRALRGIGTVQDVTAERARRAAHRESEERFRATFEQAAVGIAQVSLDGRLLRVNARLCDILGYSRPELLATTFQAITHPEDLGEDIRHAQRLESGEIDSFSMEKRYIRGDGTSVWANLTASAVRDESGQAMYYIGVVEDISSRKEAEEALAFVAEAGRQLTTTLDPDAVLDTLLELVLPRLGDYALVDLVDDSGSITRWRMRHVLPEKQEAMRRYRALYPPGPHNPRSPIWRVVQTGTTVVAQHVPESFVETVAQDEEQARLLRILQPRSFAILPLVALGRTAGALSLCISESDREYGDADLMMLEELARRAAAALENARLHDRVQQELEAVQLARGWTERLQALTTGFVKLLEPREVGEQLAATLRGVLGADWCSVYVHDPGQHVLELLARDGGGDDHPSQHEWRRFEPRPGLPIVEAMQSRNVVTIPSIREFRERYPALAPRLAHATDGAYAAAGLHAGDRCIGAVNFSFPTAHEFTPEESGFIMAAAQHAAQALERAQLLAAERQARAAAEAANRTKSQFLSTISHELRTPLTAVIGVSELLETDVLGPTNLRQKDYLSRMRSSAWHLVTIIDEILTFSRSEAGKEEVRLAEIDVAEIARSVVGMLASEAHRRGIALSLVGCDRPVLLISDGGKVRQILTNLVGNALKFTESGSVGVELERGPDGLIVQVRDTGPGIPPDRLEDIFEPFVQVDGSMTRTRGGTGLGLTICRKLARLLGGDVQVQSTVASGSTFTVRLPTSGGSAPAERDR